MVGDDKRKMQTAERLHEEAMRLEQMGDVEAALRTYKEALEFDPRRAATYYNIGLIYKYRLEWKLSADFNRSALLYAPQHEAALWNLGIAATALGDWQTARDAWRRCGIRGMEGSRPTELDFGSTPVRLNPDADGEVVWAHRIDPARARIESIPLPESGFRYQDLVLHDGAPVGNRVVNGREHPVFNVLALLQKSDLHTFAVELQCDTPGDVDELKGIAQEQGCYCEDWACTIRILCKKCSEGTPHEHYGAQQQAGDTSNRTVGIAAESQRRVNGILDTWTQAQGRTVLGVELGLE